MLSCAPPLPAAMCHNGSRERVSVVVVVVVVVAKIRRLLVMCYLFKLACASPLYFAAGRGPGFADQSAQLHQACCYGYCT